MLWMKVRLWLFFFFLVPGGQASRDNQEDAWRHAHIRDLQDIPEQLLQLDSLFGLNPRQPRTMKPKRGGESSFSSSSGKKSAKKAGTSLKSVLYQGKEKGMSSSKTSKREGRNGATNRPTPYPSVGSPPLDVTLFPTSLGPQTTKQPTTSPTLAPISTDPTARPNSQIIVATVSPATNTPTSRPTNAVPSSPPTGIPTTVAVATSPPSTNPTVVPTKSTSPSNAPTDNPTTVPTSIDATSTPSTAPTDNPTTVPTSSTSPSPTDNPTAVPTSSSSPSITPTDNPSTVPTSIDATAFPSSAPTDNPTSIATSVSPTNAEVSEFPSSIPTQPVTLPPTAANTDPFDITFTFVNTTTDDESFVRSSAARWESVILSGEEPESGVGITSIFDFAEALCTYPDEIDDLHICSGVFAAISDGEGGALAFGGAERTRANGVPFTGLMAFDPADAASLDSTTVLHEMGHALGFGTLWSRRNFVGSAEDGCPYSGTSINTAYNDLSGCGSSVLLEVLGTTPASCGFHFDESCFQQELMTPTFNTAQENPLSVLTIAALEDIGYTVNYTAADEYTVDDLNAACVCRRRDARNLRLPTSGRLLQKDVLRAHEFGHWILQERTVEHASVAILYKGEDGTIGSVIVGNLH